MSEGLKCAYCHEALPEEIRRNHGFCKCQKCRRILLVRERLLGMQIGGDGGVDDLSTIVLLALSCAILLAFLGLAIGSWAVVQLVPFGVVPLCAHFAYDGYLSIRTRVHNWYGITRGTQAVLWGVMWLALGVLGGCGIVWAAVISILRGPPAKGLF